MTIAFEDSCVRDVTLTSESISLTLTDGRVVSAPIARFPRLSAGSEQQRSNWRLVGNGLGVHWPELDEDISPRGLLRGDIPHIAPGT